jgi:hypothetical protein
VLKSAYIIILCLFGAMAVPITVPLLPVDSVAKYNKIFDAAKMVKWENTISTNIPMLMADRLGWEEMAQSVSSIYHALPEEEQSDCSIFCANYGEAGAIDYYSGKYGIPQSISGHLSHYIWGWGAYDGKCLIMVGIGQGAGQYLLGYFDSVESVPGPRIDHMTDYENGKPIYVCRGLKIPLGDFWKAMKNFG